MGEEHRYKLSRYNVQFERDGEHFLWNTLTDALFLLDEEGKSFLTRFPDMSHPYFNVLRENGCIIDARYNELGKVLTDEKTAILNPMPPVMRLTIAPGLDCNYHCRYCFEAAAPKTMSSETMKQVCAYIQTLTWANANMKQLGVTWFGGEPLLHLDEISQMSNFLIGICEERGIHYAAGIVTNGRFLTRRAAMELRRCKVEYAQVSVDGMPERYCRQKGASAEDFAAVVRNLQETADVLPITVRINVSKDLSDAMALTGHLLRERALDGKVKIYIAQIRRYGDISLPEERASHSRFLALHREYMKLFGVGGLYTAQSLSLPNVRRRRTTCHSICSSNFCIGPEGELYRCEHMFGNPEQVVGTVWDGRFYSENELEYVQFRHLPMCEACPVLPVCMGGCVNDVSCGETVLSCSEMIESLEDSLAFSHRNHL